MMRDSSTFTCPKCGRKQKFLADEWPDPCICGYDADTESMDDVPQLTDKDGGAE